LYYLIFAYIALVEIQCKSIEDTSIGKTPKLIEVGNSVDLAVMATAQQWVDTSEIHSCTDVND